MSRWSSRAGRHWNEWRTVIESSLLRWALVLYTITIVIGILNGTDLVEFERNLLLTHLHAGTVGWITLAVLASMLWIFEPGGADESGGRLLALASIAAVVVYIAGFFVRRSEYTGLGGGTDQESG